MPTVCGLAGITGENRTLGVDLFSPDLKDSRMALIVNKKVADPHVAVIGETFYLSMEKDGSNIKLYDIYSKTPLNDIRDDHPEIVESCYRMVRGQYETAKYLQYHNKK